VVANRSDVAARVGVKALPVPDDVIRRHRRTQVRWIIHLLLIAIFAASLATVTLVTEASPHLTVGSIFAVLAGVHVAQRRQTATRLGAALCRGGSWLTRRGRLAWSDLVLAVLTVNVVVSGIFDLVSSTQVILRPRAVGIPFRDIGWHVASSLVLLAFLCVHVARRWGRIRRSVIR
jgi:hypothetical protein